MVRVFPSAMVVLRFVTQRNRILTGASMKSCCQSPSHAVGLLTVHHIHPNTNIIFVIVVAARSAVAVLICLPSGIKFATFCSSGRSPAWHPVFPRSPLSERTMPERLPATATLPPPLRTPTPLPQLVLMLHFRDQAFRSVGRSNLTDSCPVFTPSKDANDGRVAFSGAPCSPGGEDGPSIVTLIEVCRSFLALDLRSAMSP